MSWNDTPKRKATKQDVALRWLAIFALIMATLAVLSIEARAQMPQPTATPVFASTSWPGPGPYVTSTPVLQPWPQVTPSATPIPWNVYLPLIGGNDE